mgnify:CR=1 FL=1
METTIYNPEENEAVTVMEVRGDVDDGEQGADGVCGLMRSLVSSGALFIVMDLSQTDFLASEALGEMLALLARVRLKGGDLVLVARAGAVLAALNAVRVGDLTQILESRDEAIALLAAQAGESRE